MCVCVCIGVMQELRFVLPVFPVLYAAAAKGLSRLLPNERDAEAETAKKELDAPDADRHLFVRRLLGM